MPLVSNGDHDEVNSPVIKETRLEVDLNGNTGNTNDDANTFDNSTQKSAPSFQSGVKRFFFHGPMNLLLPLIPVALICWLTDVSHVATFVFSLLSIAPLAERLGFATEQLAIHTSHTIGGLLNVTFGNATELIVSVAALMKNYYRLVQLSLLGSILSNLLLVLGCAFWLGGARHGTQQFRKLTGQLNSTMLLLVVMGLMFPAVLNIAGEADRHSTLVFSRVVSIVFIFIYGAYVYLELKSDGSIETHDSSDELMTPSSRQTFSELEVNSPAIRGGSTTPPHPPSQTEQEGEEEEEEDLLGRPASLFCLAFVTILIAILSEALVQTIEKATDSAHINTVFVSTIILPIIGNASEHASAVVFGMKNKMELAVSIAVGSSTQIAVFVIPLLVIISWCTGKTLNLNFKPFETATVLLTVIMVSFAIQHGKSNWLVGLVLIAAYFLISVGFYVHNDEAL
mmetsp:Transcript_37129/g.37804  ORF Transcript_37129/g.37804 Transcript_37129/m.37804 type:complete len:454 (+) Transcript_37129:97-1458(+)|eukprot:CAMPEP_0182424972 /NCGR_PEP_ID=MMETSP1167-20130531/11284_1 /TAXON_ID=2988 /ORGANISM="Mallomonas Sp, Strain CCMP3275" /LENGTH=453 /DNA_ID=CAMNT_0024605219 /DNA_START=72 /DNA_END=1433 /DNA_ORIENTATION=+